MISMSGLDLSSIVWNTPASPSPRARASARQISDARSDLPCPFISLDRVEYKSMATGEMITSNRQHREHLKRNDLIEVGNESTESMARMKSAVAKERAAAEKAERKKDLMEALKMHEQGFRNAPLQTAESVGITAPFSGTVRANAPVESSLVV